MYCQVRLCSALRPVVVYFMDYNHSITLLQTRTLFAIHMQISWPSHNTSSATYGQNDKNVRKRKTPHCVCRQVRVEQAAKLVSTDGTKMYGLAMLTSPAIEMTWRRHGPCYVVFPRIITVKIRSVERCASC